MERYYSIDFLKFFAALAVVVIHANPFEKTSPFGWEGEAVDLVVETLARWAVPFFFMVSGFFFGRRVKSGEANLPYLRKNILSLVKLYASWTVFYLLYDLVIMYRNSQLDSKPFGQLVSRYFTENWSFLSVFYLGNAPNAPHLWFLTALIWSLLIVYRFNRYQQLNLLLGLSLLLNVMGVFDIAQGIHTRETLFVGLFYTTSGMLIAHHGAKIQEKLSARAFLLIPVLLIMQVLGRILLVKGDYFLSTIPLVWLIMLFGLRNQQLGRGTVIARIGANSDGIYLIHWFLLKVILLGLGIFGWEALRQSLLWGLLFPPVLFLLSYLAFEPIRYLKLKLLPK